MEIEVQKINKEEVGKLLDPTGKFSQIPEFEYRESQVDLLNTIIDCFNNNQHLVAEAGTGTGKSLAYLLPAIYEKEKVLVSTATKALQDQLFLKDIPAISNTLGVDIKVGIAKGKNNFLCLKKVADYMENLELFSKEELNYLQDFKPLEEQKGEQDSCFDMPIGLWPKVCVNEVCTKGKCSFFEECYFYRNKKILQEASVIICNHHLFVCDLAIRSIAEDFSKDKVLPKCSKVVIDEGHNFESVCISNFTKTFSKNGISHNLSIVYSKKSKKGILPKLIANCTNLKLQCNSPVFVEKIQDLMNYIEKFPENFLQDVYSYVKTFDKFSEVKYRLKASVVASKRWENLVNTPIRNGADLLFKVATKLDIISNEITGTSNPEDQNNQLLILDLKKNVEVFYNTVTLMERFLEISKDTDIRWIETYKDNVKFNLSPLDIASVLKEVLYPNFQSVIFTSATLTFNKQFDHIIKNLGLNYLEADKYITKLFPSPFNYKDNCLIFTPYVLKNPNDNDFTKEICPFISDVCLQSQGRAFVLFTSFSMLNSCYDILSPIFKKNGITLLSQSLDSKSILLQKFKSTKKPVLFGTSTFWEGVDIQGEQLQCIIIPKIPFAVPTDPIVDAKMELITNNGGSSFMDYMLPEAAIKLQQGFGRLIRSKTDRGSVWFFDNRLYSKGYGKQLLNSLPDGKHHKDTFKKSLEILQEFTR